MSLSSFNLTAKTSHYTVDVVGGSSPTSAPWGRKRITQAFSALLIAMFLAVTGLFAGGSPAQAAWMDDAVRSVFCSNVYFNTDPDNVWGGPNTTKGMPKDDSGAHGAVKGYDITAYEKYGTSGLGWTAWAGPDTADEMKNEGDMGGRQLVTLAGGDNKLDSWAKMKDGPEDQRVFYNADESCGDPVNQGWTLAGNLIMTVNGAVVWLTGFVFQTAYETASSIIHQLDGTITDVVKTLTSALYFELFEVMVMLAALWMGYVGLVQKKSTQMAQGALWMFGAAFLGGLMLANPMAVSNTVNGVVSKVSETAMTTISKTGVGPLSEKTSLCAVDDRGNSFAPADTPSSEKPDPEARGTVRVLQCSLWQSFLYNPWIIGQFGHAEGKADGIDYIKSEGDAPGDYGHISAQTPVLPDAEIPATIAFGDRDVPANWALLQLDSKVNYYGADNVQQGKHMLHIASAQTFEDSANPEWKGNRTWTGQSSLNRVTMAIISFVGLIGTAVMIVIISMEIIVLQIGLVILALLAPIFALVAVHPGMGRRIGLMYVNTVVELALRRIVLSVMLAVMIAFYAAVIHAAQSADWLITMIMMVAVSIGGIMYKNKILQMFSGAVNMGGAGKMNMGDGITDKVLGKAGNVGGIAAALGLAALGGGAGAAATHLAGKAGEGLKGVTSHEGSFVGVGQRPQARKDGEASRKEADATTQSDPSEKDLATTAGARPMDRSEDQSTAPIPVVTEATQEDVAATPDRPAVQTMDKDVPEVQEEVEEAAPRPEAEAGALLLVEPEDADEDVCAQAGDRPAPLHYEAGVPTAAPVAAGSSAAPAAAAGAVTGAAVAGAHTAAEGAPRPAARPSQARRPLPRKATTRQVIRKGLPALRVLPGGASTTKVRSMVKDPAARATLRAARKTATPRVPVMGMVHSVPKVFTTREAIMATAAAPVNGEAPVAPRKSTPKAAQASAGALPAVQAPGITPEASTAAAAPLAQAAVQAQGGLPAPSVVASAAAPKSTATAPQASTPGSATKGSARKQEPKSVAPKTKAAKPSTPVSDPQAAAPKQAPAQDPFPRNAEFRQRAEQEVGGKVLKENPGLGAVILKGTAKSAKAALPGSTGNGKRKSPVAAVFKAPIVGMKVARQEPLVRRATNEARDVRVDKVERRLGQEAIEARKVEREREQQEDNQQ